MDKDRDISRSVIISKPTPRKVGFVGGAVLAGSALFVAACGGGAVKGEKTGGVTQAPTNQGEVLGGAHATPVATAKVEVPTVAPTATVEAGLAPEQVAQIASQVDELITGGLSNPKLTSISINQAGGDDRYLDPEYTNKAIANCDISLYGQSFFAVNLSRTVQSTEPDYSSLFLINCAEPAEVAKTGFKATGDQRFKDASEAWQAVHKRAFDFVKGKDPKVTATWKDVLNFYYVVTR